MNLMIILSLFVLSFSGFPEVLKPDEIKAHCLAFGGDWVGVRAEKTTTNKTKGKSLGRPRLTYSCKNRMEFQQKPVSLNGTPTAEEEKKFCEEGRQGKWTSKSYSGGELAIMAANGMDVKKDFHLCLEAKSPQGVVRYPSNDRSALAKKVEQECVQKWDWSQVQCMVTDSKLVDQEYDFTNQYIINRIIGKPALDFADAVLNLANIVNKDYIKLQVHSLLKDASKNLNSCQKACLVKCASSKILTFSNILDKFDSMNYLYNNNKGICSEFSRLCKDIGNNIDVRVTTSSGFEHFFNSFYIDGEWYYGEPQNDECEFFHTQETLEKYKEVYENEKTVYEGGRTNIRNFEESSTEIQDSTTTQDR
jgi:hypothetical protein